MSTVHTGGVVSIGECMLELSEPAGVSGDAHLRLRFGGDTLNTAIYMARQSVPVSYITALGDDRHSDWLIEQWRKEAIDVSHVERLPGRRPGLYWIKTDEQGEREFAYWRAEAPVRQLLDDRDRVARVQAAVAGASFVYLSGITLSLFDDVAWGVLLELLSTASDAGVTVCFDGNYRPAGWVSKSQAKERFESLYPYLAIVLPTFDDERLLFGDESPETTLTRLASYGIAEIVVKDGPAGCLVGHGGDQFWVAVPKAITPVDTTSAGDSFNAGYLAARYLGLAPAAAASRGHNLAAVVISHRGAIVPKASMKHL